MVTMSREYNREWREKNLGYVRLYQKQWQELNPERIKVYEKRRREKNPERTKQWRGENPKYMEQYYEKNRERIKEQSNKYHQEHREVRLKLQKEYFKNYHREHKEYWKEYNKQWAKTEKGKANNQRSLSKRRAKMKEILNTLTSQEWLDILEAYNYRCAYCDIEFDCENLPEKDHIIPITKGGNNVKKNIAPACRSCNAKKYNKVIN